MIRVAIVAGIRLYREGLARILERNAGLSIVATASTTASLASVSDHAPDVVLIHMAMPDGVAAIGRVLAAVPHAKVVSLGIGEDDHDVLAAAEAGAVGYVPREGSLEDLLAVIECASRGEAICSPRIVGALLRRVAALASDSGSNQMRALLTTREREIVRLIDDGLSNKEIARQLSIEVATVKNHVHNILEKLHVHRRGEAAARARGTIARRSSAPRAIGRQELA